MQPQQLPGVGAGQWLPSPSTVGAWAGEFFQPPWEEVAYAGVHTPFRAGLSSNLASEVMNDPVPAAHLCGTAEIWRCNVKPEDSFGGWKGLIQ